MSNKNKRNHSKQSAKSASKRREQERLLELKNRKRTRRRWTAVICVEIIICIAVGAYAATIISGHQVVSAMSENNDSDSDQGILAELWAEMRNAQTLMEDASAIEEEDTEESEELTYPDLVAVGSVGAPVSMSDDEVLACLSELSEEYELIAEICEDTSKYPTQLLESLANNPEMADYVLHYPEDMREDTEPVLTDLEKEQDYPLFLQWDPRWGYETYGKSTIALAGCGPASLSMALYYITRDETITPDVVAAYSMERGYYVSGTGTSWSLIEDMPKKYGVSVTKPGIAEDVMKQQLDDGKIIICVLRAGDFTYNGHFIVIYGYDDDGFMVNDPNCVARSRERWTFAQLKGQIKQLWALG